MATKSSISQMFGKSPFRALQKHSGVVQECVHVLPELFAALLAGKKDDAEKHIVRISTLESEADDLKNELRAHLPKSLFMPVDRRDLLEILDFQDTIADTAQDIAGVFNERAMDVPKQLAEPLRALVDRCVDACDQSDKIINELDELVATGFRGRESDAVSDMVDELNGIESDTDKMGADLARKLFSLEKEMTPVSVILWYDIIKMIGGVADYSEKVGNRLRLLMAR